MAVRDSLLSSQRMAEYERSKGGDWVLVKFAATFVLWVVCVLAAIYSILSLIF